MASQDMGKMHSRFVESSCSLSDCRQVAQHEATSVNAHGHAILAAF